MRRANVPKINITRDEEAAHKKLRKTPDMKILKADKGNATVITDTTEYNRKMLELLSKSGSYKKTYK